MNSTGLSEIAGMSDDDRRFLLNYIALAHPGAYADARRAQEELNERNATAKAREQE